MNYPLPAPPSQGEGYNGATGGFPLSPWQTQRRAAPSPAKGRVGVGSSWSGQNTTAHLANAKSANASAEAVIMSRILRRMS